MSRGTGIGPRTVDRPAPGSFSGGERDGCRIPQTIARHPLALLLAVCLVALLIAGCARETRHDVLTFFFTGVPSLEEQDRMKAAALEEAKKPPPPPALTAGQARRQAARGRVVQAQMFAHGPFSANACYLCHEVAASGGIRGFGKKEEAAGATAAPGIVPGQMVAPLTELCVGCHEGKSASSPQMAGLWVHGPVANGYCVVCHGPHSGPEPYLLRKKADALCVECHAEGLVFSQAVHQGQTACTSCHNPHAGKDSRLLKAEYREAW
jgi:predicted CXXCH cytochrome family protein